MKKVAAKKDVISDMEYWKYISAIRRIPAGYKREHYDEIGIKEGFFDKKNRLLFYSENFETLSFPADEKGVLVGTLKMMLKDITRDKRILDERLGEKCRLSHFNKQKVQDLASRPASLKRLLRKRNKSK
jgi:hypothetical protein